MSFKETAKYGRPGESPNFKMPGYTLFHITGSESSALQALICRSKQYNDGVVNIDYEAVNLNNMPISALVVNATYEHASTDYSTAASGFYYEISFRGQPAASEVTSRTEDISEAPDCVDPMLYKASLQRKIVVNSGGGVFVRLQLSSNNSPSVSTLCVSNFEFDVELFVPTVAIFSTKENRPWIDTFSAEEL